MQLSIPYESPIERDCLILLDVLEGVVAFRPQPLRMSYSLGNVPRDAYPDFEVTLLGGRRELWECKPDGRMPPAKEAALRAAASDLGLGYRVMTPASLRRQPTLANAAFLREFAHRSSMPRLNLTSAAASSKTVRDVLAASGEKLGAIMAYCLHGHLAIELSSLKFPHDARVRTPKLGARSGGFLSRHAPTSQDNSAIRTTP